MSFVVIFIVRSMSRLIEILSAQDFAGCIPKPPEYYADLPLRKEKIGKTGLSTYTCSLLPAQLFRKSCLEKLYKIAFGFELRLHVLQQALKGGLVGGHAQGFLTFLQQRNCPLVGIVLALSDPEDGQPLIQRHGDNRLMGKRLCQLVQQRRVN